MIKRYRLLEGTLTIPEKALIGVHSQTYSNRFHPTRAKVKGSNKLITITMPMVSRRFAPDVTVVGLSNVLDPMVKPGYFEPIQ